MRKLKLILGLAVLLFAIYASWQIATAYVANLELQEDLRDVAAEIASRIGLAAPSTEDDLCRFVIQKAESHDIELKPSQITVRVTGTGPTALIYIAADYTTRINLIFFSLTLHFTPASNKKSL